MVLWIGFDLQAEIEAGDAYYGKSLIANLLLQANASPTAVDKYGRTPAQCAKQRGHGDLAARLLEAVQAAALE